MATPVDLFKAHYLPQIEALQTAIKSPYYTKQAVAQKQKHLNRLKEKYETKLAELERLLRSNKYTDLKAAVDMIEKVSNVSDHQNALANIIKTMKNAYNRNHAARTTVKSRSSSRSRSLSSSRSKNRSTSKKRTN